MWVITNSKWKPKVAGAATNRRCYSIQEAASRSHVITLAFHTHCLYLDWFTNGSQVYPSLWESQSPALEFQVVAATSLIDPLQLTCESTTSVKRIHPLFPGWRTHYPWCYIGHHRCFILLPKWFPSRLDQIFFTFWAICLYELTTLVISHITGHSH